MAAEDSAATHGCLTLEVPFKYAILGGKVAAKLAPYYLVSLASAKWSEVLQCEMLFFFKDEKNSYTGANVGNIETF